VVKKVHYTYSRLRRLVGQKYFNYTDSPSGVIGLGPVTNYTAQWQRQSCVNNLRRVLMSGSRTHDFSIESLMP